MRGEGGMHSLAGGGWSTLERASGSFNAGDNRKSHVAGFTTRADADQVS
jgi:hypothetical protein